MLGFIWLGFRLFISINFNPVKHQKINLVTEIAKTIALRILYAGFFYAPLAVIIIFSQLIILAVCPDQNKTCLLIKELLNQTFVFLANLTDFSLKNLFYIVILIAVPNLLEQLLKIIYQKFVQK